MKTLIPCACGCGKSAPRRHMTTVRRLWVKGKTARYGRHAAMVLKKHATDYENELAAGMLLEETVSNHLEAWIWRRLYVAPRIYRTTIEIHQRNRGPKRSRQMARRAVALFLIPQWQWSRRLTLTKNSETRDA